LDRVPVDDLVERLRGIGACKRWLAGERAVPPACSGDMYPGVPTITSLVSVPPESASRETPKSRIFQMGEAFICCARNRFCGFRSRCTTPATRAASSPAAT
jgi:hypothetical protein